MCEKKIVDGVIVTVCLVVCTGFKIVPTILFSFDSCMEWRSCMQ